MAIKKARYNEPQSSTVTSTLQALKKQKKQKKQKNRYGRSLHLFDLSDALARGLTFLHFKQIHEAMQVSRLFGRRCREALKQLDQFHFKKQEFPRRNERNVLALLTENCPNLVYLKIGLDDYMAIALAVKTWPNLRKLKIQNVHWIWDEPTLTSRVIPLIAKKLRKLEVLHFVDVFPVANVDLRPLESLHLRGFALVDYKHHKLSETNVPRVIGLDAVLKPDLQHLCLMSYKFDLAELCRVCDCGGLRLLRLCSPSIRDDTIEYIPKFAPNLKTLGLRNGNITSRGLRPILKMVSLRDLALRVSKIECDGIDLLCRSETLPKLRRFEFIKGGDESVKQRFKDAHPSWKVE